MYNRVYTSDGEEGREVEGEKEGESQEFVAITVEDSTMEQGEEGKEGEGEVGGGDEELSQLPDPIRERLTSLNQERFVYYCVYVFML